MATDLEVGIRYEVAGVEVETPGAAILPVQRFGSILRESSDATFRIESDGEGTTVRGERSQFKLPSENPQDFPADRRHSTKRATTSSQPACSAS